jgi:hypothetical protein
MMPILIKLRIIKNCAFIKKKYIYKNHFQNQNN